MKNNKIKCQCVSCHKETNHSILLEKKQHLDDGQGGWWEEHTYQIVQCFGCDSISFRKTYTDVSEQYFNQELDQADYFYTEYLYPKRNKDSKQIRSFLNIPNNIKKIYRETIDAFNNDIFILCSAGIRAIIEGICNDKGVASGMVTRSGKTKKSKNLDGKIEGLVENKHLGRTNADTLHDLRFLGNDALHDLTEASIGELKLAIEIVENLIENIYEIEHKRLSLKKEKIKRKGKP